MKILRLLALALLGTQALFAQSLLSGSVKNPDGSGFNGRLIFSLSQNASASSVSPCTGPTLVVPVEQVIVTVNNGTLVSPPTLLSSYCTIPVGIPYNVIGMDSNGNPVFTDQWLIGGSTFNVGTAVSSETAPVVSYQGYWQLTETYNVGDIVSYGAMTPVTYISIVSNNTGNIPATAATFWQLLGCGCSGGGGGFSITSFTGCGGSLELGQTVTNPTCGASYSSAPSSAAITNSDSIDSPLNLISPFTSGTIVGSFHHTTSTSTTVTLTALGASSQTATQTYTWQPRIFGGVGAGGATSSVTASGTTAVLSTSDVLASAGLGTETTGETFGPYSPSAQYIYLLLTSSSHTFIDANTGFPFAFNAPTTVTFTNEYGVSVTMYLYQSTNALYGSYLPKVTS